MTRRTFATTWWGKAWVDALEQRAQLDPNRLPRGRTYARQQRVGELAVAPGEVAAAVQGRRDAPYRVRVRVRELSGAEWETVLDAIAARAAHAAALLDGELPPAVLDDVSKAGIDLLPGPGEIGPRCSCPDWADPCKHAAAVCYLVADVLDRDPFELLHLRGRDRDAVLAALRARRATSPGAPRAERDRPASGAFAARAAFARPRSTPDHLWEVVTLLPPLRPGRPAPLPVEAPPETGIRIDELTALAADTVPRACELATGDGDGGLALDLEHDLARRAASSLGTRAFDELARRSGTPPRLLARRALAWGAAGADGVDILTAPARQPDRDALADAVEALRAVGMRPRVAGNRVTAGRVQLRLARDGTWYRLDKHANEWELVTAPHVDPRVLVEPEAAGVSGRAPEDSLPQE